MGDRQKLVTRVASEILEVHSFEASGPTGAQALLDEARPILRKRVKEMRPGTLGIIAASGAAWSPGGQRTALYEVHCAAYIDKYGSGRKALQVLAMTAIVAEMWDILVSRDPRRADRHVA